MAETSPIPASWIRRRTSSPDAVRRQLGHLAQARALLDAIRPGDELRSFSSSPAGWRRGAGIRGYVVVRDGTIVARAVTART